jgi:hypothetical protein
VRDAHDAHGKEDLCDRREPVAQRRRSRREAAQ